MTGWKYCCKDFEDRCPCFRRMIEVSERWEYMICGAPINYCPWCAASLLKRDNS